MMDRMTEYMVENGHETESALVTGSEKVLSCQEHVAGFRRALLRSGIEPDDTLVLHTGFTEKQQDTTPQSCFLGLADRPTAICCATDLCAIGAMRAIHDAGPEVPG
ncbi:MAG: substrate-binding domain-containing protein [Marinilabiliales bacterium]|nr:substrate-binding domain-containing protein [Marinilabiliales bacterium]